MILFKPEHVEMILSGKKTQTRRFGKKRWNVGSVHACYTRPPFARGGAQPFCRVRIKAVQAQCLGSMSIWDAQAEGYDNVGAFVDAWERINGQNCWSPRLAVWVVSFELRAATS
jgi:hypothetical protein